MRRAGFDGQLSAWSVAPDLRTSKETSARRAIDDLQATFERESSRLKDDLAEATSAGEAMRIGLLYGSGDELEAAVGEVLTAAGLSVRGLNELLGDTISADLPVTYGASVAW